MIVALAGASAVAARLIRHHALGDLAHVMDEIAYVFQAKLFASGHLATPVVEPRGAFNTWFIDDRTARFSIFPPGWPAVLAVGAKLGMMNWVNPTLHGLTVVLVGRAGERVGGPRLALLTAALYALSPQAVFLAASVMSHPLIALASATMLLLVLDLWRHVPPSRALVVAAGAGLGISAATRPVCATLLALLLLVTVAWSRRGRLASALPLLATIAVTAVPFVAGLLAFNHATTGSAFRFPQTAYFDEHLGHANLPYFHFTKGCNALGFGPTHGCDITAGPENHTLDHGLSNVVANLRVWLLLAASPLLAALVVLALVRHATRRLAGLLLVLPACAILAYSAYWQDGTCLGARFYHAALPPTLLVAALAIMGARPRVAVALAGGVLAWNVYASVKVLGELTDPAWGYWGVDARFAEVRRTWQHGPAVVMVAFGGDDLHNPDVSFTSAAPAGGMWMLNVRAEGALAENAPFVDDGEVVFAKFHPALVPELQARFPGRSFWLFVTNGHRERDRLEPWTEQRDPRAFKRPPENFDGFRMAPPELRQPPIFIEIPY
ncbi:MAG: hypothetical protein JWP97_2076 [Labilithrix sp.]|nr:hypothetical protein [Labilithrix sp.]